MLRTTLHAVLAGMLVTSAPAAMTLESGVRMGGREMHAAFEDVQPFLQSGSAVFKRGNHEIIFGVVVSPEGHLLTKASELGAIEDLKVVIGDRIYEQPVLLAVDPQWDVALVKVSGVGLQPVDLGRTEDLERGEWLVANGATTRRYRRVQVGMVAASPREVKPNGGAVLGIVFKEDGGLVVSAVSEGSGAEKAGIQEGDKLLAIDGRDVAKREEVLEILEDKRVGQSLAVRVERDGGPVELKVVLAGRTQVFGEEETRNDHMSGDFSMRRTGFPRIMQHDIIGNSRFMGGPVLDLDGRCVGMNIARFSRCETYAIPALELQQLVRSLMDEAQRKANAGA
ncbi:S1C family serine protease [Haloferula sargassicola]|uniref:PDZ domain-containing protein n=1 Tax=Haloferula sargassicola TaxID=490096 RepID=A0ABP9UPU1_9BACT